MSSEIQIKADGKVLMVRATGKLTSEIYERFMPEVERLIQQHGKVRVLFEMQDFHGWTAGAAWQDLKFALKHFRDIERVALVGDKTWEHSMVVFCRPFTMAKIRYFDKSKGNQAESWIHEGLPILQVSGAGAAY